jgi:DNA gyrase inhibitor GyrI
MNRKIGRARHDFKPLDGAATEKETMKASLQTYHARMQRALDHIDRHLDGDLDLETVSRVAAFSKFHFHERFKAWCKTASLSPETGRSSFMVFRSERCPANPADYSMDLCVGTDQPIEANDEGMKAGVIPGGRCAVLRYPGNTNNLEPAALYLYRDWLPGSGEEARDFPIYCQRRLLPIPEVPAHEAIVELFLPLK